MPFTRLRVTGKASSGTGLPANTEQSSVLPVGSYTTPTALHDSTMVPGTPASVDGTNSLHATIAQTTHQDQLLWRSSSPALAAQTIAAGTWSGAFASGVNSVACVAKLALSVYVWRPSTAAVVGYIYDSDTALTSALPTTITAEAVSFTGSAVTCADGDILVVELWAHITQTSATSNTVYGPFGPVSGASSLDDVAGSTTQGYPWLDAPSSIYLLGENPSGTPGTWSYVGTSVVTTSTLNPVTPSLSATGYADGDVGLLGVEVFAAEATWSDPPGWDVWPGNSNSASGSMRFYSRQLRAGDADPAVGYGTTGRATAVLAVWRYSGGSASVEPSTPTVNDIFSATLTGATLAAAPGSITDLMVAIFASIQGSAGAGSLTGPAGWTKPAGAANPAEQGASTGKEEWVGWYYESVTTTKQVQPSATAGISSVWSNALFALAGGIAQTSSPAESLGLSDSVTVALDRVYTQSGDLGLSDTATAARGLGQSPLDALGLSDTVTVPATGTQSPLDALGLSDALTSVWAYGRPLTDSEGLSDLVTAALTKSLTVAVEALGLSDAYTLTAPAVRSQIDAEGLTDTITALHSVPVSQVGLIALSDAGFDRGSLAVGADTAMLSDTVSAALGPAPPPTATPLDLLGLADTAQSFDYAEAGADALGLSDSATASKGGTVGRTASDLFGGADDGYRLDVTETQVGLIGLSDSVSIVKVNQTQSAEDMCSLSETVTYDLEFVNAGDRVDLDVSVSVSRLQRVLTIGPSRGGETVSVGESTDSDMEVGGSRSGSVSIAASQTDRTQEE